MRLSIGAVDGFPVCGEPVSPLAESGDVATAPAWTVSPCRTLKWPYGETVHAVAVVDVICERPLELAGAVGIGLA